MDRHHFEQLVRDTAAGDAAAYRSLLEASARLVRGYLSARVTGAMRADIEDIVQETLLAVHTKYHSYDVSLPYLPWLRTIAHHKLVDNFRRRKMAAAVPLDDSMGDMPAADAADSDSALTLDRLMGNLNDKQQQVVRLARIDGKTMAEIATEMTLSVADVKVTLHRALRKLGRAVRGEDDDAHG